MKHDTVNLTPTGDETWRKIFTIGSLLIQISWATDFWISRLRNGLVLRNHLSFHTTYCPDRNYRHYSLIVGRLGFKVAVLNRQPAEVICDE